MSFDGKEGDTISLEDAAEMTAEFRSQNPNAIKGQFFGKDILNDILGQFQNKGIRFYHGINSSGDHTLIAVGAKSNEDDQIRSSNTIAEYSKPCPPICGNNNALNS